MSDVGTVYDLIVYDNGSIEVLSSGNGERIFGADSGTTVAEVLKEYFEDSWPVKD